MRLRYKCTVRLKAIGTFRPRRTRFAVPNEVLTGARPMHPDWLRGLRDQVHAAGAKLFAKQIGSNHALWPRVTGKGEDPAQWPADLRVQDFPQ